MIPPEKLETEKTSEKFWSETPYYPEDSFEYLEIKSPLIGDAFGIYGVLLTRRVEELQKEGWEIYEHIMCQTLHKMFRMRRKRMKMAIITDCKDIISTSRGIQDAGSPCVIHPKNAPKHPQYKLSSNNGVICYFTNTELKVDQIVDMGKDEVIVNWRVRKCDRTGSHWAGWAVELEKIV